MFPPRPFFRAYFQSREAAIQCRDMIYACGKNYDIRYTQQVEKGWMVVWS